MKPESKLCEYILNETECTVLAILPSSNSPKKQNVLTKIQFNIPEPFIEPLLQSIAHLKSFQIFNILFYIIFLS